MIPSFGTVNPTRHRLRQARPAQGSLFQHDDGPDLAEAHAHLLGHLVGIAWQDSRHLRGILEDGRQIRTRALRAAAQLFRRIGAADGRPVVLQLQDLHWADDETLDFPVLYASGRAGTASWKLEQPGKDIQPVFEALLRHVPAPHGDPDKSLQVRVTSIQYNDYVGRIGVGRIYNGRIKSGQQVTVVKRDGSQVKTRA